MEIRGRKLLVVENGDLKERISHYFADENAVLFADNFTEARKYLRFIDFDSLVMDMQTPENLGWELLKSQEKLPAPVSYSFSHSEEEAISALNLGAIDFIDMPCSMRLLEAKLYHRLPPAKNATLVSNALSLNPLNRVAKYGEREIPLTASEFNVLYFLMKHSGEKYSADELYEHIWKAESLNNATVRKHISTLRAKLEEFCEGNAFISNEFGKGYSFRGTVTAH